MTLKTLFRSKPTLALALMLGGALVSAFLCSEDAKPPMVAHLVLDMTVPPFNREPWAVTLYVNSDRNAPLQAVVKPGVRSKYDFPVSASEITFLRIDPVQVAGVEVAIHSLTIESKGAVLRTFGPQELVKWGRNLAEGGRADDRAFYLRGDRGINHIASTFPGISISGASLVPHWRTLIPDGWPDRLLLILAIAVVATIVLAIPRKSDPFQLLLLAATALLVVIGTSLVRLLPGRPFGTASAVGGPNYTGYPKTIDTLIPLALVAASVVGAVSAWAARTHWAAIHLWLAVVSRRLKSAFSEGRGRLMLLAMVCLFMPLYYTWGAEFFLKVLLPQQVPAGWDNSNGFLWRYLVEHGAMPYRDFWFPYGGHMIRYLQFPWGFIAGRLFEALVLILSLLSFYLVTDKSLSRTLAIFGLWFGLAHLGVFPAGRYAVMVPIVLSYICVSYEKRRIGWPRILFWAAIAASLLDDLLILLYSGFPILVLLCLEAVRDRSLFFQGLRDRLLRDFLVPAVVVSGFVLALAWNGQLSGLLEFYRNAGAMATYAANPVSVRPWLGMNPIDRGFFMWAGVVLLGFGIYLYLTDPPERRKINLVILLLGISSLVLFNKQMVHADPAFGWMSVPTAGCLFLLFARGDALNRAQRLSLFFVAGLFLGVFWSSGIPQEIPWRVSPSILKGNLVALSRSREARVHDLEETWDLKRFKEHPALLAVLDAIKPRLAPGKEDSLFALSDEQILYIMARQNPPYYCSLYDGSPLEAQKKVVDWLQRKRPSVVVFDTAKQDVFGVPAIVRAPLTYEKVILNYVLDTRIGSYAILRPRKPGEPVDVAFWQAVVGVVDLGHLPRYSSIGRFAPCPSSSSDCAEFLLVQPKAPLESPADISIPVTAARHRFEIKFRMVSEQKQYAISLDRLWFWGGLRRAGLSPALAGSDPGLTLEIVRRAQRDDILY